MKYPRFILICLIVATFCYTGTPVKAQDAMPSGVVLSCTEDEAKKAHTAEEWYNILSDDVNSDLPLSEDPELVQQFYEAALHNADCFLSFSEGYGRGWFRRAYYLQELGRVEEARATIRAYVGTFGSEYLPYVATDAAIDAFLNDDIRTDQYAYYDAYVDYTEGNGYNTRTAAKLLLEAAGRNPDPKEALEWLAIVAQLDPDLDIAQEKSFAQYINGDYEDAYNGFLTAIISGDREQAQIASRYAFDIASMPDVLGAGVSESHQLAVVRISTNCAALGQILTLFKLQGREQAELDAIELMGSVCDGFAPYEIAFDNLEWAQADLFKLINPAVFDFWIYILEGQSDTAEAARVIDEYRLYAQHLRDEQTRLEWDEFYRELNAGAYDRDLF